MESANKPASYGATTVAFGDELLDKIGKLADKFTDGNTSELIRVITENAIDKIEAGEFDIRRGKTKIVETK